MTALTIAAPLRNLARVGRGFAADRVLMALCAGLILLAVYDAPEAGRSLRFIVAQLLAIAPFLFLAVALAAGAKASGADRLIARAFSGSPLRTIVAAALVGALSPFCSCGVIPLIAALLAAGVPLAPVMAFWIASPIMDPEMFILTAAGISPAFAVAKTLATVGMGLYAGFAVLALQRAGGLREPLRAALPCCGCGAPINPESAVTVAWRFWKQAERRTMFAREAVDTAVFLGRWLAFAFFLESLMTAYVPGDAISTFLGGESGYAIPLAAVVGMPAYLNGYAAIPLVSGLLDMGMSPGAGLAFMTAGAVSSIPAAIAVWALVRPTTFALYLALGLSGALMSGYLYALFG